MNKYQEALDYIKHDLEHNDFIRYKNGNHVDKYHREVLLKLVDKETPMKRSESISNAFCGKCGYAFGYNKVIEQRTLNYKHLQYCPCCGQKIDWRKTNE